MPYVESEIWLALKAAAQELVMVPTMTLVMPAETFDPPISSTGELVPYILLSDNRDPNQRITIGPQVHLRSGTLGLTLTIPTTWAKDRNLIHDQIVEMQGKVAKHFHADRRMRYGVTCLRVQRDPDTAQPYRSDGYMYAPITVPWGTN